MILSQRIGTPDRFDRIKPTLLTFKHLIGLGLIVTLFACAGKPVTPEAPAEPELESPPPATVDVAAINRLLDAADEAIRSEHLTFPKQGSALQIYRQILELAPEQEDARRGLENIVERYVELASAALEREQYATARSMLARGRLILPQHPSIEPTAAQIRLLQEADRTRLNLSPTVIRDSIALTEELKPLVSEKTVQDVARCRFKIWAVSDRAGRQIYQSLSQAYANSLGTSREETPRLKAQLAVRSPSSVERICFNPT